MYSSRKKYGFTLLELVVVIIIVSILSTLGLTQYAKMVEKGRGAEARVILGSIRTAEEIWRLEYGTTTAPYTSTWANLGMDAPQTPTCQPSHYFSYGVGLGTNSFIATATRCTGGGKSPDYATANTLTLTGYAGNNVTAWGGTGYGTIW